MPEKKHELVRLFGEKKILQGRVGLLLSARKRASTRADRLQSVHGKRVNRLKVSISRKRKTRDLAAERATWALHSGVVGMYEQREVEVVRIDNCINKLSGALSQLLEKLNSARRVRDNIGKVHDRVRDELKMIDRQIANLAGVGEEHIDNIQVSFGINQVDIYSNRAGILPFGKGHGHIVLDLSGEIVYVRAPKSR